MEAAPFHPTGLIGEMNPAQLQVQAAEKAAGGGVDLVRVAHMPLAGNGGEVAGPAENFCDGMALFIKLPAVASDTLVRGHPAYPGLVGVESGQERGPGRTAAARVVEL